MTSAMPVQCSTTAELSRQLGAGHIVSSHQIPVGLKVQLVEHCTGIAEVMGSNRGQA